MCALYGLRRHSPWLNISVASPLPWLCESGLRLQTDLAVKPGQSAAEDATDDFLNGGQLQSIWTAAAFTMPKHLSGRAAALALRED